MMDNNSNAQLNTAESALLSLIGKSLFGIDFDLSADEQLAAIEESKKQGIFCLAADSVRLSPEYQLNYKKYAFSAIRNNLEIFNQHGYLHEIMTKENIPYVVLKGAASAYYYSKPQLRMMGDVDFLVSPDDFERASVALTAEGFTPWNEKHICHMVFRKEKIHFEMHFAPAGIPYGEAGEKVKRYLSDAVCEAKQVESAGVTFMNPSLFIHGLVMLLHMQHHLLAEGIGLRHLSDWAVFVNHFTNEQFTERFEEKLKECGLWRFAVTISLAASIGIGLPYRDFMGTDKELAKAILCDIVHGGNFGRKDKNRVNEGMFISNRGKNGVKHNRIAQLFRTVNEVVYTHWPISKKVKFLLPFGWIYWGGRRLLRVIKGTRAPLNLAKSYHSSQSRKELYSQLHLFEVD